MPAHCVPRCDTKGGVVTLCLKIEPLSYRTRRTWLPRTTNQRELMTLQRASSQHIRRLAWWSASTDGGTRMGSTSQFSSDSYRARMKSPARDTPQRHTHTHTRAQAHMQRHTNIHRHTHTHRHRRETHTHTHRQAPKYRDTHTQAERETHTHTHTRKQAHTQKHKNTQTSQRHTQTHKHSHTHTRIETHTHTCRQRNTHAHTRMQAHTQMHRHTHTQTHQKLENPLESESSSPAKYRNLIWRLVCVCV